MTELDDLDGCDLNFDDDQTITQDFDLDALVMFADVWDDPAAVEARRRELIEWAARDA